MISTLCHAKKNKITERILTHLMLDWSAAVSGDRTQVLVLCQFFIHDFVSGLVRVYVFYFWSLVAAVFTLCHCSTLGQLRVSRRTSTPSFSLLNLTLPLLKFCVGDNVITCSYISSFRCHFLPFVDSHLNKKSLGHETRAFRPASDFAITNRSRDCSV